MTNKKNNNSKESYITPEGNKLQRKAFLKKAGTAVASAAVLAGSLSACTPRPYSKKESVPDKRLAMVIDLRKCYGCHSCTIACKSEFNVPLGVQRSQVETLDKGRYPDAKRSFLPRLCNHCANPSCVSICPTKPKASHRDDEKGLVDIHEELCIGCNLCIPACPYGVRFSHPVKNIVNKCDFCIHRVEKGVVPSCVNTCPSNARIFGDLNDPESEVSKMVATNKVQVLKPEFGCEPSVFYIEPDKDVIGGEIKRMNDIESQELKD
ncbi:MAG: 4Fe-4S dicluster domain-containing protein [Candidatus Brocadiales bacterium]|nr:4Fe-4S dicluster domain-containing protein [Candidatus Brocadiales bacterium]